MRAYVILERLHNLGVTVAIEGDRLAVQPKERLTPELRQAIREHKPDLMRFLDADREGPPYPDGLGRVKCFYCRHCEITGTNAKCRVSGESRTGIALLITCSDYTMT